MQTAAGPDYEALARRMGRDQFIASCPCPFLVARALLAFSPNVSRSTARPPTDGITIRVPVVPLPEELEALAGPQTEVDARVRSVLPVRKRQSAFPSMITVGRTANNDVVINDPSVSRFHAFFQPDGERYQVADAGSSNGTWVGLRRLESGDGLVPVDRGERLRFGNLEFTLLDAGPCWDVVRNAPPSR